MNNKNICKNCRFWEAYKGDFVKITYRYNHRSEIHTKYMLKNEEMHWGDIVLSREEIKNIVRNIGYCNNHAKIIYDDPDLDNLDTKYQDDALYYFDGEGYSAWFKTGENFGCIHFEQKGGI